jgi:pyruvate,water dikinase
VRINLLKEKTSFDTIVLQQKYTDYLRLLSNNDLVLRIMSELKEKSSGDEAFEIGYLRLNAEAMLTIIKKIITRLNRLSENKYTELNRIYDTLKENIDLILSQKKDVPFDELALSYEDITAKRINSVGGKNAQLGEIKNKLGLAVPEGFAVTAYAYKTFLENNNLEQRIEHLLSGLDINDFESTIKISSQIQDIIRNSPLPQKLSQAIEAHCKGLTDKNGGDISFSVRSSAAGESTEFSFAGQYTTVLNVDAKNIVQAYKDVVASRFSQRALFYLANRGFRQDDIAMSVGCMIMVRSKSSGVIHTINPFATDQNNIIINAIWGLGKYIVEGDIVPDLFIVSKADRTIIESRIAHKPKMLIMSEGDREIAERKVSGEAADKPSIQAEQIRELTDSALKIEQHYRCPQIIEWACDEHDKVFILQTTPLGIFKRNATDVHIDTTNNKLLISNAETASSGIGYGPVFFVDTDEDISRFPNGGIAMVRHSSPKFVSIMNRAKAIVADIGSPTGHMATLAREFQIPAIVNAHNAVANMTNGMMVSVDADHGCVYQGYVEGLFKQPHAKKGIFKDTPALIMMNKFLEYVTPLNLIDPDSPGFTMKSIHTMHDIIRFAHQASMNEMFLIAQNVSVDKVSSIKLKTPARFEVYIIDLGGGLKKEKEISEASVTSIPFLSFWSGIKKENISVRPVSKDGFVSVVMNTMANPQLQERLYEKNLALISNEYMNFNIRMGYHISTIEGLCTKEPNDNYIRFIFQGGGADFDRRIKRAQLIAMILQKYQFYVKQADDIVRAICTKSEQKKFEDIMSMLGRLTIYTKQLDMIMPDNRVVLEDYVKTFINEIMEA